MSVKIPLSVIVAGALSIFALSTRYGMELQKKSYKRLFKISFTSKDEMARKLANRIIFEDLRVRFEPVPEDN